MNDGFESYWTQKFFMPAIAPALRCVFELWQTNPPLAQTHGLALVFDHDPSEKALRNQFELESAEILSHAELADFVNEQRSTGLKPKVASDFIPVDFAASNVATAIGSDEADVVRLAVATFAHFYPRSTPGRERDRDGSFYRQDAIGMTTGNHVLLMKTVEEAKLEMIPPQDYDWGEALRLRLKGGQPLREAMGRRTIARRIERKEFMERVPTRMGGVDWTKAQIVRLWDRGMEIRDDFGWNVNQSTSLARVLSNDEKLLLGGQLAYVVAQTTCGPTTVKARTCGGGDASDVPFWGIGFSKELDAIILSYSGTNTTDVTSVLNNAEAQLVPLDASLAPLANRTSGVVLVHDGYQAVTLRSLGEVLPGIQSALAAYPAVKRVLVSGHSQGAAMAVFASLAIFLNVPASIRVHQTVTCMGDPIPHALFPGPIYRHSIGERWIQKLTGDGTNTLENSRTLACDGEENINCSDSLLASSYNSTDHTGPYFGVVFGYACSNVNETSGQYGLIAAGRDPAAKLHAL
ncbi:hypothetical protein RQP46_007303 [Phenoliferia psychrophenolica]